MMVSVQGQAKEPLVLEKGRISIRIALEDERQWRIFDLANALVRFDLIYFIAKLISKCLHFAAAFSMYRRSNLEA